MKILNGIRFVCFWFDLLVHCHVLFCAQVMHSVYHWSVLRLIYYGFHWVSIVIIHIELINASSVRKIPLIMRWKTTEFWNVWLLVSNCIERKREIEMFFEISFALNGLIRVNETYMHQWGSINSLKRAKLFAS